MKVYNAYLKILKYKLSSIIIYFILFVALSLIMIQNSSDSTKDTFVQSKGDIVVNNYDNSKLVDNFLEYMSEFCNIDQELDKDLQQDAIFFREVDYIITIPKGFGEDFLAGKNPKIEKFSVPDSSESYYIDQLIYNYFQSADLFLKNAKGMTEEELISSVNDIVSENAVVHIQQTENEGKDDDNIYSFYFKLLGYSLTAMIIIMVGTIMISFNKKEIYQRSVVSPISLSSLNIQLVLGNLTFVGIAIGVFIILGIILNPVKAITFTTLLYWCNLLVYAISILCLAYMLSFIVKNKAATDAVATIISLGGSFISGIFVDQSMLSETVLKVSSFFPTYWFVLANDTITSLSESTQKSILPIAKYMLVELAFAAAFFSITLVLSQYKRRAEN